MMVLPSVEGQRKTFEDFPAASAMLAAFSFTQLFNELYVVAQAYPASPTSTILLGLLCPFTILTDFRGCNFLKISNTLPLASFLSAFCFTDTT